VRQAATCLQNMASVRVVQHRLDDAIALYERALALKKRLRGTDSIEVGLTLFDYAVCLFQAQRFSDAREKLNLSIAIFDIATNGQHPIYNYLRALKADLDASAK